jgi:hypothetical protein
MGQYLELVVQAHTLAHESLGVKIDSGLNRTKRQVMQPATGGLEGDQASKCRRVFLFIFNGIKSLQR